MTKFKREQFNTRAGGGYIEYCIDGYLAGKRFAVGRFKYRYKGRSADMKRLIQFIMDNMFVEEFTNGTVIVWDLMKQRGWQG